MSLVLTLDQVINSYRGKTKTIRQQRCLGCSTTLAVQATDNVESASEGDFYIIVGAMVVKGMVEPYYQKCGRWFGNPVKCPKCNRQGNLPGDKPYNWDEMKKQREVKNV